MWNSQVMNERLLNGWEKSKTSKGVPYYVNHKTERTQWEHPQLMSTLEELGDMDDVKYSAYRTAMKLRFIQKRLKLDLVSLSTLSSVLERHGYSGRDAVLDVAGLTDALVDMYALSRKDLTFKGTSEDLAEFLLSWLTNVYDVKRTGSIHVLAVKVGIGTLCSARLNEKYKFFFQQMCDESNFVSRKSLGAFFHDIMQLPEHIGESVAFGGVNILPPIESCFKGAFNINGITEDVFLTWLQKEPQTLVWLPTMHRMATAESVKHESKCNICKVFPIVGLRYRCLKCFNFDMCQDCFLSGRTSKKHKLKHPTQEYCIATSSKEDTKAFMKTIRNNISKKHRNKKKLRYLPVEGANQFHVWDDSKEDVAVNEIEDLLNKTSCKLTELGLGVLPETSTKKLQTDGSMDQTDKGLFTPRKPSSIGKQERQELQSIICHLEDENRHMLNMMDRLSRQSCWEQRSASGSDSEEEWILEERERMQAKQEILEAHNKKLQLQLERLKTLIKQDQSSVRSLQREPLSTISPNILALPKQINKEKLPFMSSTSHYSSPDMPRYNSSQSGSTPFQPTDLHTPHGGSQPPFSTPYSHLGSPFTLTGIDFDLADRSLDLLGQSHFSLPSLPEQSKNFSDEEAELDEMMDKLDEGYPLDVPHNLVEFSTQRKLYEISSESCRIRDTLSKVTGNVDDSQEQSIWDLADELLDREVMASDVDDTCERIHDLQMVSLVADGSTF